MANWVICTNEKGDKQLINFDYASAIHENTYSRRTEISLAGEDGVVAIRENIDQLIAAGLVVAGPAKE